MDVSDRHDARKARGARVNVSTAPAHRAAATLRRELELSRELTAVMGEAASLERQLGPMLRLR